MAFINPYVEQSIESSTSTEPEIYGENIFSFDENLNILLIAENLASEAKYLINILKTIQPWNIQEQFQIELRKTNDDDDDQCLKYRMSLRIDSVLWFKHHKLNDNNTQNLEHLYRIGSNYIEKVKDEIKNEYEIKRLEINSSSNKNYHITVSKCIDPVSDEHKKDYINSPNFRNNRRQIYQSRSENIKLNGRRVSCVLQTDTVVKASNYPYFIVTTRSDTTAVITIKPVKNCLNEDYVQTCDAWQAVLQTLIYMKQQLKLDKLPLNYIDINFGKWILQKADDSTNRSSCNAQINIVLTRETINKINDENQLKDKVPLFPSLVGSIIPLRTHYFNNSWKLIEFMNDHMTPTLIKRSRELKTSVGSLKREFEKLKQENECLTQLILNRSRNEREVDDVGK